MSLVMLFVCIHFVIYILSLVMLFVCIHFVIYILSVNLCGLCEFYLIKCILVVSNDQQSSSNNLVTHGVCMVVPPKRSSSRHVDIYVLRTVVMISTESDNNKKNPETSLCKRSNVCGKILLVRIPFGFLEILIGTMN